MKLLIVLTLIASIFTYDAKLAYELGVMANISYESVTTIQNWSCSDCKKYNVTDIKSFINQTRDIQGFVGYSHDKKAIIASFRGSVDFKNWIADLDDRQIAYIKCTGCTIHEGFYKAYQEISATVRNQVQTLLSKYPGSPIYISGHSLGGALAQVGALDIKAIFGRVDQLYTYGQPRLGNHAFADYADTQVKCVRVIHYADIVTHLPPRNLTKYVHSGEQIWYTEDMQKYRICTAEDNTCAASLPTDKLSANDHHLVLYLRMPTNLVQFFGLRRQ